MTFNQNAQFDGNSLGGAMTGRLDDMEDTIGGRITRARNAIDLSTAQLARRLGIRTGTLTQWESDRSEPRANRLMMMAGLLNVSPTWLLTGQGEAPSETMEDTNVRLLRAEITRLRDDAANLVDKLDRTLERLEA